MEIPACVSNASLLTPDDPLSAIVAPGTQESAWLSKPLMDLGSQPVPNLDGGFIKHKYTEAGFVMFTAQPFTSLLDPEFNGVELLVHRTAAFIMYGLWLKPWPQI